MRIALLCGVALGMVLVCCTPSKQDGPEGRGSRRRGDSPPQGTTTPSDPVGAWGLPASVAPARDPSTFTPYTPRILHHPDEGEMPSEAPEEAVMATPIATIPPERSILRTLPPTPGWSPSTIFQRVDPLAMLERIGPPNPPIHRLDTTTTITRLLDWDQYPNQVNWDPSQRVATHWDALLDPTTLMNHVEFIIGTMVRKDESTLAESYLLPEEEFGLFMDGLGRSWGPDEYQTYRRELLEEFRRKQKTHTTFVELLEYRQDRLIGLRRFSRIPYVYQTPEGEEKTGCLQMILTTTGWFLMELKCHREFDELETPESPAGSPAESPPETEETSSLGG